MHIDERGDERGINVDEGKSDIQVLSPRMEVLRQVIHLNPDSHPDFSFP